MDYLSLACRFLLENKLTIASAESLTGGLIAAELVNIPGISACFNYGYITYSNEAKISLLGVRKKTIETYGAVSEFTSREMAEGARKVSDSDIGLSSTGIAGPAGGSKEKPVGLCYISCAIDKYIITRKFIFKGSRYKIRLQAVNASMKLLYESINRYKK